ncbi:MAG: peptide ABC transporter substrate-binding protein [Acutalibacteraceae bacterium]
MKFKKIFCLVLCMIFLCCCTACRSNEDSPYDQTIYYNIESEPVTLDPQIANDSAARLIILNIFEGLTKLNGNGDVIPGVAQSWTANSDYTKFTFQIREGACWNDGTALTAQDFVYGMTRTLSPNTNSPTANQLFCIKNAEAFHKGMVSKEQLGIYAEGTQTVVIELEYAYKDFPSVLAQPCAMPCQQAFFESTAGQYGLESDKILSNGAFMLRSAYGWNHYENLTLHKSTCYIGEETVVPAGIYITIGDAPENVVEAIQNGTVDCYALPNDEVSVAEEYGLNLTAFHDTVWGLCFNLESSITKNKNIRIGLLYALKREYILQKLPDNATAATDIIPNTAEWNGQNYRQLAGNNFCLTYNSAYNTYIQKGLKELNLDVLPSIEILCADDAATQVIVNNIIETLNNATGCYFNKKPVPRSQLQDYIDNGNYAIALAPLSATGNSPTDTLSLFVSTNPDNPVGLKNSVYDNYIHQIQEQSLTDSVDTIIAAEKYLNDNGIFYPLYLESRFYASAANVTGIVFHAYGAEADFITATKSNENST